MSKVKSDFWVGVAVGGAGALFGAFMAFGLSGCEPVDWSSWDSCAVARTAPVSEFQCENQNPEDDCFSCQDIYGCAVGGAPTFHRQGSSATYWTLDEAQEANCQTSPKQ